MNRSEADINPFKPAQQAFKTARNPFKACRKRFAKMINARNRAFSQFKFQMNPLPAEGRASALAHHNG
jgi:hypothetical protein